MGFSKNGELMTVSPVADPPLDVQLMKLVCLPSFTHVYMPRHTHRCAYTHAHALCDRWVT